MRPQGGAVGSQTVTRGPLSSNHRRLNWVFLLPFLYLTASQQSTRATCTSRTSNATAPSDHTPRGRHQHAATFAKTGRSAG